MLKFLQKNWPWIAIVFAVFVIPILLYMFGEEFKKPSTQLQKAPFFAMRTFDDQVLYLEQFKGQPVVLNFWAAWCPFCKDEMPMLEKFYREYRSNNLVILGIHNTKTESKEVGQRFAKDLDITYPLIKDSNGEIFDYFSSGFRTIPMTVFINKEGFVHMIIIGARYEPQLRKMLLEIF